MFIHIPLDVGAVDLIIDQWLIELALRLTSRNESVQVVQSQLSVVLVIETVLSHLLHQPLKTIIDFKVLTFGLQHRYLPLQNHIQGDESTTMRMVYLLANMYWT